MSRSRRAFHSAREVLLHYEGTKWPAPNALAGIHFRIAGSKSDRRTFGPAQRRVARQVPRVSGKIFLRAELSRVNIDADNHLASPANQLARAFNQAQMAGVQVSHRRHEADAYAGPLPARGQALHGCDRLDDSHRRKVASEDLTINLIVGS